MLARRYFPTIRERRTTARVGCRSADRLPLASDFLAEGKDGLVGAERANGFSIETWTLARRGQVIEALTGVRYGQTQTWAILRERLGWSRQRPVRRAVERDDEAIATRGKHEWPRIKKARGAAAPGSSSKTKADSRSSRL